MEHLFLGVVVILNAVFLALGILGLPGNWLMIVLTWGVAVWHWDRGFFSLPVLIGIVAVGVAGELLEFFAGAVAVRQVGGSRRGMAGAVAGTLVGGIVGTVLIPVPVVGSLIGACAGAFLGAWLMEMSGGKTMQEAVRSGAGAGVGRFLGLNLKLLAGAVIWVTVAVSAFWP